MFIPGQNLLKYFVTHELIYVILNIKLLSCLIKFIIVFSVDLVCKEE